MRSLCCALLLLTQLACSKTPPTAARQVRAAPAALVANPIWTEHSVSGPSARAFHGLATLGSKLVLFGGQLADAQDSDETWTWNGTSWTLEAPAAKPSARQPGQQLATFGSSVLLFSGGGALDSQTWSWDGSNWTQLSPLDSPPARRGGHMAELGGALYLFGGEDSLGTPLADTWKFDGSNWSDVTTAGSPSARAYAALTAFSGKLLLFGEGETWTFDGSSWAQLSPASAPAARTRAALGVTGSSALVFGGQSSGTLGDSWEWDGSTWTQRSPLASAPARYGAALATLGGEPVLFGGRDAGAYFADTWSYGESPLAANGTSCTNGSECSSSFCTDGVCCDAACSGGTSDCQACDVTGQIGSCVARPAATTCRSAAGDCDAAESCDGSARTCPADAKRTLGSVCRMSGGACDPQETCDGSSNDCPADSRSGNGTLCSDDGNPCTRDVCDGSSTDCTHPAGNAGSVCRNAAGDCDAAETCSGSSTSCPPDGKLGAGASCRMSAGTCDPSESCDGSSNACPTDQLSPQGTPCRPAAGSCDVAESCSGSSAQCPIDGFAASSVSCRGSAGTCDLEEFCSGTAATCPNDAKRSAGTPCRGVQGACDIAESCDGSNVDCPADTFAGGERQCRAASCSTGVQVLAATCAGASASCPSAVNQSCAAYSCNTTACFTSCSSAAQCAADHFCDAGACQPERALGQSCTANNQCSSNRCVDGYCCDAACDGQCEACNVAGRLGTCSAVSGAPHGARTACDTDGSACGGSCDGSTRARCNYPGTSTVCRNASCSAGTATLEARCGGDGNCGPLLTQSCTPFLCAGAACDGDCASDLDCVSGFFCSAGVCTAKRAAGATCTAAAQCQSALCVDDVCCNSACTQQCEACDLPQALGTCSPVVGDPHGARSSCATDGSACGGSCDGSRRDACDYPDASTVCRLGSCSNGVATIAAFCDASGFCPALSQRACTPFVCAANACLGDCAEDDDCALGSVCEAGICTAKRALGQSCASAGVCASGFCVDGVCCNENCRGQCEACDGAGSAGTCTPVAGAPRGNRPACDGDGSACTGVCGGSDPDGCVYPSASTSCRAASCADGVATLEASCVGTGACPGLQQQLCTPYRCAATACAGDCANSQDCQSDYYCSAGICVTRLALGASCGADEQCQSGSCADGYCCDGRCDGQCEACDVAGHVGQCTAVVGAPQAGRAACAGTGTCAGACDGSERRACSYPGAEITCSAAACGAGVATSATGCDGAGGCREVERQACSPYPCAATSCATSCSNDSDCVTGYACRSGECRMPGEPDAGPVDAGPVDAGGEPHEPDAALRDSGSDQEPPPPASEADSDNDGIPDSVELGTGQEPRDSDRDGIPDYLDSDDDNDSIPTARERGRGNIDDDLDGDGIPNHLDTDSDGDGVPDRMEAMGDSDGDGIPDFRDKPAASGGSGGLCSAQPAAHQSPAAMLVVFGLALCWLSRRRSWQRLVLPPSTSTSTSTKDHAYSYSYSYSYSCSLAALVLLMLLSTASRAAAESFRLDQYLAPALPDDGLQVERPIALERAAASLLLTLDYADDPLVVELEQGLADTERAQLVHSQLQGGLRFAYGVLDRLSVTAGVDFIPVMSGETFMNPLTRRPVAPADGPGFGDAHVGARVIALGDARSLGALGISAQVGLPLAAALSDQRLSGEEGMSFRPQLSAELRPGIFRFTLNTGALLRKGVLLFQQELGHALTFGAGAGVRLGGRRFDLELMVEGYGATAFSDPFGGGVTPVEAVGGLRFRPGNMLRVSAGAGSGVARGVGAPDFRAIASIGVVTRGKPEPVEDVEVKSCSGTETDEVCSEPEQAREPLPELDSDGDALADTHDACPRQAEDRDAFQDADGCPDPDNDGDALADVSDKCPFDPEDVDSFEDTDGCPDPDNDGDGVLDAVDQCPLAAGTAAQNGCSAVRVEAGQVRVSQRIEFARNDDRILASSDSLMSELRELLQAHTEIEVLAVEGHTDASGSRKHNQMLSARRAQSVVRWLESHGIAAERLQAWGCGPTRPIESNDSEAGRQANRRVEFHILRPPPEQAHDTQGCTEARGKVKRP